MRIGGLQKNSLIDFPGRICAVVFTRGCNFLCPYCHNPNLSGLANLSSAPGQTQNTPETRMAGSEPDETPMGINKLADGDLGVTGLAEIHLEHGMPNASHSANPSVNTSTHLASTQLPDTHLASTHLAGTQLAGTHLNEAEVLNFLSRRKGLLDGVVISGGEPCLQADLTEFCRKLKGMGYELKLDTNGSCPQMLEELINAKLLDYVAMDLKANPAAYPTEVSPKINPAKLHAALCQSAKILRQSGLAYEFRTTCAEPFINNNSIKAIAQFVAQYAALEGVPLYLQKPNYNMVLNPQFHAGMLAPSDETMRAWQKIALEHIPSCQLRQES